MENSQNQSELELRKRVADLEEENRSVKQRLESIEMLLWQQRQEHQLFMPPQSSIQTVVHQQQTGSQINVPGIQLFQQQPNLIQKDVQERLQASGMLPPQNVIHRQMQSNPEMPSSKFFCQNLGTSVLPDLSLTLLLLLLASSLGSWGNANVDNWQEKAFQKVIILPYEIR